MLLDPMMLDGAAAFVTGQLLPGIVGVTVAVVVTAAIFRFLARKWNEVT